MNPYNINVNSGQRYSQNLKKKFELDDYQNLNNLNNLKSNYHTEYETFLKCDSIIHKVQNDIKTLNPNLQKKFKNSNLNYNSNQTSKTKFNVGRLDSDVKNLIRNKIYLEHSPQNENYILKRKRENSHSAYSRNKDITQNKDYPPNLYTNKQNNNFHTHHNDNDNKTLKINYNFQNELIYENYLTDPEKLVKRKLNNSSENNNNNKNYENDKLIFNNSYTILDIEKVESNSPFNPQKIRRNNKSNSVLNKIRKTKRDSQRRMTSFDYKRNINNIGVNTEEEVIETSPNKLDEDFPNRHSSGNYTNIPRNSSLFYNIYEKYSAKISNYMLKHKDSIRLYGSMRYTNKHPLFFLEERKEKMNHREKNNDKNNEKLRINPRGGIVDLTPLPSKTRRKMKNMKERKEFFDVERSVVVMRRLEYTNLLKGKKLNHSRVINSDNHYEDDNLLCYTLRIQRWWRNLMRNSIIDKIVKIQSVFRGKMIRNRIVEITFIFLKIQEKVRFLDNLVKNKLLKYYLDLFKNNQRKANVKNNIFVSKNNIKRNDTFKIDLKKEIINPQNEIVNTVESERKNEITDINIDPNILTFKTDHSFTKSIIIKPSLKKPPKVIKSNSCNYLIKTVIMIQKLFRKIKINRNKLKPKTKILLQPYYVSKDIKSLNSLLKLITIQKRFVNYLKNKQEQINDMKNLKSKPKLNTQTISKQVKSMEGFLKLIIIQRKMKKLLINKRKLAKVEIVPVMNIPVRNLSFQTKLIKFNNDSLLINVIKIQRKWKSFYNKKNPRIEFKIKKLIESVNITKTIKSFDHILKIILLQRRFKRKLIQNKINKNNLENNLQNVETNTSINLLNKKINPIFISKIIKLHPTTIQQILPKTKPIINPTFQSKELKTNLVFKTIINLQRAIKKFLFIKLKNSLIKHKPKNSSLSITKKVIYISDILKIMKIQFKIKKWIQNIKNKKQKEILKNKIIKINKNNTSINSFTKINKINSTIKKYPKIHIINNFEKTIKTNYIDNKIYLLIKCVKKFLNNKKIIRISKIPKFNKNCRNDYKNKYDGLPIVKSYDKINKKSVPLIKIIKIQKNIKNYLNKNSKKLIINKPYIIGLNNFTKSSKLNLLKQVEIIKNIFYRDKIKRLIKFKKEEEIKEFTEKKKNNLNNFLINLKAKIIKNVNEYIFKELNDNKINQNLKDIVKFII